MDYIPISDTDREVLLKEIGVSTVVDLFPEVTQLGLLQKQPLKIEQGLSEIALRRHMQSLAGKNASASLFIGAGAYNHFVPSTVPYITGLPEFYTAYTPYQPEISQGTLATIFEFQSFIAELTGMDFANASMYEGASALAESVIMVLRQNKRRKVLVSNAVHPHYRAVLKSYLQFYDVIIEEFETSNGVSNCTLDENTACVVVQTPNFFGAVEDITALTKSTHDGGAKLIAVITEAVSLGLLDTSAADVVCGELQSFGNALSYGGPYVGFIAAKKEYIRKIPGRLVGKSVDSDGKECFVLTLQAREQHIRREKAGSNICTNQALCALAVTVCLATLGKNGVQQLAQVNYSHACYLREQLSALDGVEVLYDCTYFNEFPVRFNNTRKVVRALSDAGFIAGYALDEHYPQLTDCILLCATEMNTKEEMDRFVQTVGDAL